VGIEATKNEKPYPVASPRTTNDINTTRYDATVTIIIIVMISSHHIIIIGHIIFTRCRLCQNFTNPLMLLLFSLFAHYDAVNSAKK